MNMQHCLILELILYKFELSHDTVEATKNICCAKDEDGVDHSRVTRWFKKFPLGFQNLDNQASSVWSKSVDFKTVLQTIEANPESCTQRVSR